MFLNVHATASAAQAFLINGHGELGDVREDPYVETVSRGLHTMFTRLATFAIAPQTYGDPDSNGNGIGLHWENLDEDISVPGLLAGRADQTVPLANAA